MPYRESVGCPVCSAEAGQPCTVDDFRPRAEGASPVHAARYALTLPQRERAEFWDGAIDRWLREKGIEGRGAA